MKRPSDGNDIWTVAGILKWTTGYFEEHEIDSPRMTAEYLLAYALGLSRIDLYLQYEKPLQKEELETFKSFIRRRVQREPLAYIVGSRGFWTLDLSVTPDVLIPRPDTETLVEAALKAMGEMTSGETLTVADLGTGSGAIILSLASEYPDNAYVAVDISEKALAVARKNATDVCPDTDIQFINSSWFDAFSKGMQFDVIVSNPPYIPSGDIPDLQKEVSGYEPVLALDGDADGLKCIRHIICSADKYLRPGGKLLLEIGFDQAEAVVRIAEEAGLYTDIHSIKDLAGNDRVVGMKKK